MADIEILFVSKNDIDHLQLTPHEIMGAVEAGLRAHGEKKVVMPSKDHLTLGANHSGHFNILKGYIEPLDVAGVKIIGDYVDNYRYGLPSEVALCTLYRPETGVPFAIVDATVTTWMRTGAVSAVGAKHLARRNSRILGHIGARGTAQYNIPLMDAIFDFEEIRIASKRPESRERLAQAMTKQLGKTVKAVATPAEAVADADVIVDASRLATPEVLVRTEWVKPGALIMPYGAVLSVDPDLPFAMDKIVVDDWNQAKYSQIGQLYPLVKAGKLRDEHIHAEIGEIVAGLKPGRENDEERILFWHKGIAIMDIVMGNLVYEKATQLGLGQKLLYYRDPEAV